MTNQQIRRTREDAAQKKKKDRDTNRKHKLLQTDPEQSASMEDGLLDMIFGGHS